MLASLGCLLSIFCAVLGTAIPPLLTQRDGRAISQKTFESLEELARIVDISYCVGSTGIQKPFQCLSRCSEFPDFELITTWNTGILLSDSCGYIAVSHNPENRRVIVAFRGTYSITNTIADLSTGHAEYAPFPTHGDHEICPPAGSSTEQAPILPQLVKQTRRADIVDVCHNCTVHSGFLTSWLNTRCIILPDVELALTNNPGYRLELVGHSLGGAVAALASLELQARGWNPRVTTFGEPRIGNAALNDYIDQRFNLNSTDGNDALYRRVTHVDDPVPLLPLEEWGYKMHAGEIYISKPALPPLKADLSVCEGDADPACIAGGGSVSNIDTNDIKHSKHASDREAQEGQVDALWEIPQRYRLWQLFFAHRDYFWRLGLCLPGGYPWDWHRPSHDNDDDDIA